MNRPISLAVASAILFAFTGPLCAGNATSDGYVANRLVVKTLDGFGLLNAGEPITITPLPGFVRQPAENGKKGRKLVATYVAEDQDCPVMLVASVPNENLIGEPVDVPYAKFLAIKSEVESDPSKALAENDRTCGITAWPIHAGDDRSFQFTATKEIRGNAPVGGIHSIVMGNAAIWAKGRFFQLAVIGAADETSVSNAVEITRELADDWYRAVIRENGLPDPDSPEFTRETKMADFAISVRENRNRRMEEELARDNNAKRLRQIKRDAEFNVNLIVLAIAGAVAIFVAAFRNGRGERPVESISRPSFRQDAEDNEKKSRESRAQMDGDPLDANNNISADASGDPNGQTPSITDAQEESAETGTEAEMRRVAEMAGPEAVAAMPQVRRVTRTWRQPAAGGRIFCDIDIGYDDAEGNLHWLSVPAGIWGDGWIGIGPKRISPERFSDDIYKDDDGNSWGRIAEAAKPDHEKLAAFMAKENGVACRPDNNGSGVSSAGEIPSKSDQPPGGNAGFIAGAVFLAFVAIMVVANADSDGFFARIAVKALVAGVVCAIAGAIKAASKR